MSYKNLLEETIRKLRLQASEFNMLWNDNINPEWNMKLRDEANALADTMQLHLTNVLADPSQDPIGSVIAERTKLDIKDLQDEPLPWSYPAKNSPEYKQGYREGYDARHREVLGAMA